MKMPSDPKQREVALWPTKENYDRFRALCDDEVAGTFEEFESIANSRLAEIETKFRIKIDKVLFDPDRMAVWCQLRQSRCQRTAHVRRVPFSIDLT